MCSSNLVNSEPDITFTPRLRRKVFGLETARFRSPPKPFFYLAFLGCVLEDWDFAKLVEEFVGINFYLALSYTLYAMIISNQGLVYNDL